ncbi:MAG TPA: LLM class flavin-dependent oxidoreductase [Ilumatobacteraceae bacterium]|nr:LLM class flavin-dependent oxidoreductase [Ilumatobacteraceae bacterium]
MSVAFGLFFDLRNPPQWERSWADHYAETIDLAVSAEQRGCRSAWVTEHHQFDDGYIPQPLTFLAALAMRTSTMRLGTGIVLAALRHPRHIAEEVAIVDLLSNGRVELGLGAGYVAAEFEMFGADITKRMTTTDAVAAEVRDLLWSGQMKPPAAQPQVPIWIGYQGPQGAGRAGRLGLGLLAPRPDLLEPYRAGLVEGGHDPAIARMGGLVDLIIASDPERTAQRIAPHAFYQRATYNAAATATAIKQPDDESLARTAAGLRARDKPGTKVVTPDEAQSILRPIVDGAPIHHLYMWATIAAMPADTVDEHIDLLFTQVAPAFT